MMESILLILMTSACVSYGYVITNNTTTNIPVLSKTTNYTFGTHGVPVNEEGHSEFDLRDVEMLGCKLFPVDISLHEQLRIL